MSALTFRQALAAAEAEARAAMPDRGERIAQAVELVRTGQVLLLDDGQTWEVDSTTTPGKRYSVNGHCSCDDAHFRGDVCKHQVSVLIAKRIMTMTHPPAAAVASTSAVAPLSTTLPEAPASANVRLMIGGKEVLVTLRGTDEAEVLARVTHIIAQYPDQPTRPAPQGPTPAAVPAAPPQCPTHGAMKPSTKGSGWYCPHKLADGTWCPTKHA